MQLTTEQALRLVAAEREARQQAEAACVAYRWGLERAKQGYQNLAELGIVPEQHIKGALDAADECRRLLAALDPGAEWLERLRSNCSGAQASNAALRRVLDYVRMALEAQHARCEDGACSFCGTVYGVAAEAHDKGCPRYVIGEALSSLNNGADLREGVRW